ncbi:MAG: formimidoylglutamate deiminase [Rhizobiaceae bacterium]|nr:formimidoylglutamate deiminase [Rhizobiaceae bacterium]
MPEGWTEAVRVTLGADGRITTVQPRAAPAADDHRADILLPAVANLHSHTFQRGMAGLAERRGPAGRDSFWTWRDTMYRFLDLLTPEDVEAIAAQAFIEMQKAGFCAVAEFHYLHHQPGGAEHDDIGELAGRIAAAASETGIGLTLLPVQYRQGGADGRALAGGQKRFGNTLERFTVLMERSEEIARALPADTRVGVAPHSLRAVTLDDLAELARLRPQAPIHIHAAEQVPEIEEITAAYGARPVELLLDRFGADSRWCLIHATQMLPAETKRLAASGAVAGLCPVTEANLGDGIFDGARYLGAGGRLGVGSDSNIRISVNEELRQLEYSQRLHDRARVVLAAHGESCGRTLYDAALAGGAQALGRDSGAIAPGRLADLVALDRDALEGATGEAALDFWTFCGGREAVRDVWSAGRHSVRSGRHVAREAIAARYRAAMAGLRGRL